MRKREEEEIEENGKSRLKIFTKMRERKIQREEISKKEREEDREKEREKC